MDKLNEEKTKYISSIIDKNTDLASDLSQLNELIAIKNQEIEQYQLNLNKKTKDYDQIYE